MERDYQDDVQILEREHELARERLNQQRDEFLNFSKEARSILRLMILFIGAPAAILGATNTERAGDIFDLLTSSTPVIDFWWTSATAYWVSVFTFVALAIGLYLHVSVSGFEVRGIRNPNNPNDVYRTLDQDSSSESGWLIWSLVNYLVRIEENDRVLNKIESYLAFGKVGITLSILGFAALFLRILMGHSINGIWVLIAVALMFFAAMNLPENYRSADMGPGFSPPYSTEYIEFRDEHLEKTQDEWWPPLENSDNSGEEEKSDNAHEV